MMTRAQLRRVILDLAIMLVLSGIVIAMGIFVSFDKSDIRKQEYYQEVFSDVIKADHYAELKHDLVGQTECVNHVYMAYDENDEIIGYIADISVVTSQNTELHSYVGVNSDGSTIVGYKRVGDESYPLIYEEGELMNLAGQIKGKPIPVALSYKDQEDTIAYSEYDPPPGLNDGVYYAQTVTKDKKGYIDYVEIEISGGRIKRVVWDGINIDPTTGSRNQASLTGAYVISGENWATQSYNICHALIELQDVSRLAMKSDGTTEIIPGVTTDISAFVNLSNECLMNSKVGFDKDMYIARLSEIIQSQGVYLDDIKDSNGFLVYPFEDLSPFKKEGGSDIDLLTVYETTLSPEEVEKEQDQKDSFIATPVPDGSGDIGPEDGVAEDPNDSIVSNSIDGIPMSEVRSFIPGLYYDQEKTDAFVTTINSSYKFFREYMNWIV
ncbi:MAG: hypothetical protein J6U54_10365 [Clostridiales bacterium]|nr:hypothetical protein [Clostridiales bacterium]